jgi:general secretion pathway protein D
MTSFLPRYFRYSLAVIAAGTLASGSISVHAGPGGSPGANPGSTAEREIARRQLGLQQAEELMAAGRKALGFGDYETAYVNFLDAVELIPPGAAGGNRRGPAIAEFSSVAMRYANWLVDQGRFPDAEKVAKTVLLPEFNPTYRPAVRFLSDLEQPDVFNKTVTPEFAAQRDEVNKLFQEAEGFYASGRFDLATKRYNQILAIDPYNSAARQGMERVDNQRQKYFGAAYDETRSRMLWEVNQAWQTPVPRAVARDDVFDQIQEQLRGTEGIQAKLNRIIIPRVELQDTTLREALTFLQQQSVRLDTTAPDDASRGVNMVLRLEQQGPAGEADGDLPPAGPSPTTRINLSLSNVPLGEALRYLAELAGTRVKVEPFAVTLVPLSVPIDTLVTREYRVPSDFIPPAPVEDTQAFIPRGELRRPTTTVGGRLDAQQFLEQNGISFPPGATAQYIPQGSKLIVRNTLDNIELVDNFINAAVGVAPTQVEIESKFLEVGQNNLQELGFDWLLGPVAIGGGVYGAGGDRNIPGSDIFPFSTTDQFAMTQGLRTGSGANPSAAITDNSIEALLATRGVPALVGGALAGPAPGIFGIGGIFTNPQFQVLIRALSQKSGVDLLSAPKVTAKSGRTATIRAVRKMFYPDQFDPPTVADAGSSGDSIGAIFLDPRNQPPPPVTPSFPSNFTSRDIGVLLSVTPVIGGDSYTITMELTPEVVEFDGFINYGSPINTVGWQDGFFTSPLTGVPVLASVPRAVPLTENPIPQPIFSTRKVNTNVTIWDGQTVSIGGLMRDDIQKVEDKIPLLGDIPLAGRLFRSNVDQTIKKNLIIFVTANIIDAEGQRIRRLDEEMEDIVDPLGLPERLSGPQFPAYKGGGLRMK